MGDRIMTQVKICVDIPEDHYRAYEDQAERQGVSVESLVRQTLQCLLEDAEREGEEGTDHLIIPS
jgi:predicted HicB family RNase H-like nuclease